jgi:hypothetical protein
LTDILLVEIEPGKTHKSNEGEGLYFNNLQPATGLIKSSISTGTGLKEPISPGVIKFAGRSL